MKKLRHSQLYNPLGLIRQHQVYFNTESLDAYEGRLVAQTIQYLNGLTCEQLKRQSVQLFKWLVVHQPTDNPSDLRHGAARVLPHEGAAAK